MGTCASDMRTSSFIRAAKQGDVHTVRRLLHHVNPCTQNHAAIRLSAELGHTSVVQSLLEDGRTDPGAQNNVAVRTAAALGHTAIVQALLQDARVDPSAFRQLAIRSAIKYGRVDVVRLLLADVRVNTSNELGNALMWTQENGHREIIELLLTCPHVQALRKREAVLKLAANRAHRASRHRSGQARHSGHRIQPHPVYVPTPAQASDPIPLSMYS